MAVAKVKRAALWRYIVWGFLLSRCLAPRFVFVHKSRRQRTDDNNCDDNDDDADIDDAVHMYVGHVVANRCTTPPHTARDVIDVHHVHDRSEATTTNKQKKNTDERKIPLRQS